MKKLFCQMFVFDEKGEEFTMSLTRLVRKNKQTNTQQSLTCVAHCCISQADSWCTREVMIRIHLLGIRATAHKIFCREG